MAFRSIIGNKLRSFLTMLGIIIGVASVIVLVSIGQGSTDSVTNKISTLGTNLISVSLRGTDMSLEKSDIETIKKLEGVEDVAPYVSTSATLKNGTNSTSVSGYGVTASYATVKDSKPALGRFISDLDVEAKNKVIVLGYDTSQTLFGLLNPVEKNVLVNGVSYKVIGVLPEKGTSTGSNGDSLLLIPFSTAQRLNADTGITSVYVSAKSENAIDQAVLQIKILLGQLFPNQSDAYSVSNSKDLMETLTEVSSTMTTMLGGIASISLIVGGIGIMNIMLVSVTERTKEIGIRKAIGAKRWSILSQFLIEAIVLSALGGIIGIGAGIGVGRLVEKFASMAVSTSVPIIFLSFGFSILTGIIFGVFPANKASKLNPIEALRFE
ncbi:MAG: transporter permease [Bacillales bacterium]|jgi:putative ABC transport system permease protein|nr:transporter permease [Bacillales bacterium]